jgi:hypothetical protein
MRDRLGTIVLVAAAVLLLGVALLVILRGQPEPSPEDAEPPPAVNDLAEDGEDGEKQPEEETGIQISGTELTIREEGEVIWRASFGGEIELDKDNRVAQATDVLWEFEGQGFQGLTLTAPQMRAAWDERRLHFSEGVLIESEGEDLRFRADTAVYQFDTQKVIGRGDVRFQRGNFYGHAEEVVVDNRREVVRLKRGSLTRRQ